MKKSLTITSLSLVYLVSPTLAASAAPVAPAPPSAARPSVRPAPITTVATVVQRQAGKPEREFQLTTATNRCAALEEPALTVELCHVGDPDHPRHFAVAWELRAGDRKERHRAEAVVSVGATLTLAGTDGRTLALTLR
ncbi:MAG: hypothetical protein KBG28_23075 [Kofleriaceae bacterium]|nr:hypothetical protein [Kofleriaceae bacterium]MBP9206873.1 hypothetical protein [Kofleriaceae bacterium]